MDQEDMFNAVVSQDPIYDVSHDDNTSLVELTKRYAIQIATSKDREDLQWLRRRAGENAILIAAAGLKGSKFPTVRLVAKAVGLSIPQDPSDGPPPPTIDVETRVKPKPAAKRASPAEQALAKAQVIQEQLQLSREFLLCDIVDPTIKNDHISMEVPLYSLTTRAKDMNILNWVSRDKTRSVTVTPGLAGRATQLDKDIIIYITSQITEAMNRGRSDTTNRYIHFNPFDFLVATGRETGGTDYRRISAALERLNTTNIRTNIKTGGIEITEAFNLIDGWSVVDRGSLRGDTMVRVKLSDWLYNAIQAHEVLSMNPKYFKLAPLERRLYELARKHCGRQQSFTIEFDNLLSKCGSQMERKDFGRKIKNIIASDSIPDYQIAMAPRLGNIVFGQRSLGLQHDQLLKLSRGIS